MPDNAPPDLSSSTTDSVSKVPTKVAHGRRVNAPYFGDKVGFSETAIFWFGHVTPTENYADVRVGYDNISLFVHIASIDRRLWYNTSPSPEDLSNWDAVTLYLDTKGSTSSTPDASAFRFDAQLVWWEERDDYQAVYQGDGSGWVQSTIPFTTTSGWRGDGPNNDHDDRGWTLTYLVPFEHLGLSGPPEPGTIWGMALAIHDRDDGQGTPIAEQVWPETMHSLQPATWGQLTFGMPTYTSPPTLPGGTITIRHGLNGATVVDADVGGSSICGQEAWPDFFPTWGDLNYAGKDFINIQNQGDIADWPCFSKFYVTFPLDSIPADKGIISATLTLYLWGGAGEGWDPGPKPSLIQVLTAAEDWAEDTITWNNAPLAIENISATWVEPVDSYPGRPGIPYHWDVSQAVADAYLSNSPLRLVLYESDWAYHSGKYFDSCDVDEYGAQGRPTLKVAWGDVLGDIGKTAMPTSGSLDDSIAYELGFYGTGRSLTLTDTLSVGMSAPLDLSLSGTSVYPVYDGDHHRLTWSDAPPAGQAVNIGYSSIITTPHTQILVNTVSLREAGGALSTESVAVYANPYAIYLPLVPKIPTVP